MLTRTGTRPVHLDPNHVRPQTPLLVSFTDSCALEEAVQFHQVATPESKENHGVTSADGYPLAGGPFYTTDGIMSFSLQTLQYLLTML